MPVHDGKRKWRRPWRLGRVEAVYGGSLGVRHRRGSKKAAADAVDEPDLIEIHDQFHSKASSSHFELP